MSMSNLRTACAASLLLIVGGVPSAIAQGTGVVPSTDLAYDDLERLRELGLLQSGAAGQRAYSRREFARLVRAVREATTVRGNDVGGGLGVGSVASANAIIARLADRFVVDSEGTTSWPEWNLVDGARLQFVSTDAVRRGFAGSNASALEATIDPLARPRPGRPAPRGESLTLELSQRVELTPWLSAQATERLELRWPRDSTVSDRNGELLAASVRARYRNAALSVGRQQIAWGQTRDDGLFFASDGPALDLISLGSDRPFRMPSVFRVFGPTQAALIVAELGPSRVRSHSKLLAYKVSVQPRPSMELGASFMNHYGGSGGRSSSFGNRVIDFLPFIDIFRTHNYYDTTRTLDVDSDKLLGVDARIRFARLGGLTLTGEVLIDDFDVNRIPSLFTWDGAQSFGAVLPWIGGSPLSLHLSAKHTGIRTYTHGALSNGITTRGRLLGDELGPDAKAFGATVRWAPAGSLHLAVEGRRATYSKANYATELRGNYFVIRRVGAASNEQRDRGIVSLVAHVAPGLSLVARAGGERIANFDFTGRRRRDYAADLALQLAR